MTDPTPRRRVALPEPRQLPRAGKIRLGEQVETTKNGKTVAFPRALGHFVAREDDSGITSAKAAAAFHARYGDAPTEIDVVLIGETAEDALEGAYRLYGGGGRGDGGGQVKRKCDGETCDVRTATGWVTRPCECVGLPETVQKNGKDVPNPDRCTLRYTLNVLLPDVDGLGVWQVDTGSMMGVEKVVGGLRMVERFAGSLERVKATLRLVPMTVSPGGMKKTVHVLDLAVQDITPRDALEGRAPRLEAGQVPQGLPPASSLDDARDPLIDPTPDEIAAADAANAAGEVEAELDPAETRRAMVGDVIAALSPEVAAELRAKCEALGLRPSARTLAGAFGDAATTLDGLRGALDAAIAALPETLPTGSGAYGPGAPS